MQHSLLDYFTQDWQLVILYPVLFLGAVFGGGYLLWRNLRRQPEGRRLSPARPIAAAAVGAAAAAFCGGITMLLLVKVAGPRTGVLVGGPIALAVGLGMAWMVWYTMLRLSARQTLQVALVPLVAIVLWTGAGLVGGAIPARAQELARLDRGRSVARASRIYAALQTRLNRGDPLPSDLQTLVQDGLLPQATLRCPMSPDRKAGYFYYPARPQGDAPPQNLLLVCSYSDEQPDHHVIVLHPASAVSKKTDVAGPTRFERLLSDPENAAFAAAWRKATEGGD